jgi:KTSC domain
MGIERKPIRRGGLRSAGYDSATRLLEIEFDGGSVLQYSGVGAEIARRLLTSASPASYYRDNIEEEFPSRKLR